MAAFLQSNKKLALEHIFQRAKQVSTPGGRSTSGKHGVTQAIKISSPSANFRGLSFPPSYSPEPTQEFGVSSGPQSAMAVNVCTVPRAYPQDAWHWDGNPSEFDKFSNTLETSLGTSGCYAAIMDPCFYGIDKSDNIIDEPPPVQHQRLRLDLQSKVCLYMAGMLSGGAQTAYETLRAKVQADKGSPRDVPTAYELFQELRSRVHPDEASVVLGDMITEFQRKPPEGGDSHDSIVEWVDRKSLLRHSLTQQGEALSDQLFLTTLITLLRERYEDHRPDMATSVERDARADMKNGMAVDTAIKKALSVYFPQRFGDAATSTAARYHARKGGCIHMATAHGAPGDRRCHWCGLPGHWVDSCQIRDAGLPKGNYSKEGSDDDEETARRKQNKQKKMERKKEKAKESKVYAAIGQQVLESQGWTLQEAQAASAAGVLPQINTVAAAAPLLPDGRGLSGGSNSTAQGRFWLPGGSTIQMPLIGQHAALPAPDVRSSSSRPR